MFKFFKSRKPKKSNIITVYAIYKGTSSSVNISKDLPIYYASTLEEAKLAIDRLIYINHSLHFKLWCDLRNLDTSFEGNAWASYLRNLYYKDSDNDNDVHYHLPPEDQYVVLPTSYSSKDLASLMRIFVHTTPLLLGIEREVELIQYIKSCGCNKEGVYDLPEELLAVHNVDPKARAAIDTYIRQLNKSAS